MEFVNYRRSEERIFALLAGLSYAGVVFAFIMVLFFHFYEPRPVYRDFAVWALILSVVFNYQILLHKIFVMEIRISNLMHAGRRGPGKPAADQVGLAVYSILFWLVLIGCALAFFPAPDIFRPDFSALKNLF